MPVDNSLLYSGNYDINAVSGREICFTCYRAEHIKPDCTTRDPARNDSQAQTQYVSVVENNYFLLSELDTKTSKREKCETL